MPPARPLAAILFLAAPALAADDAAGSAAPAGPDFDAEVRPVLTKYCAGCHNAGESYGEFALHDFDSLMRGGYEGAVIEPGDDAGSRLFGLLDGTAGELMPPADEPRPTAEEVELLRAWVRAGAHGGGAAPALVVPTVAVTAAAVSEPVHAVALSPDGTRAAVGRYGRVEVRGAAGLGVVRTLVGVPGHVHAVGWLGGETVFAAAGEPGLGGAVAVWDLSEWSETGDDPKFVLRGHADAVLAAALSPVAADGGDDGGGRTLATGGYDQTVRLWDPATGLEKGELKGHNGPVFGLAFHPTLPLLATASGDRTVKLWDAATGELKDTLTEPAGPQLCVAFTPDGRHLLAAGGDKTLRAWELTAGGAQGTTPVRLSQFVHRGPVLALAFTPSGRLVTAAEDATVKLWDAPPEIADGFAPAAPAVRLADWPAAVSVAGLSGDGNARVLVGLLDGAVRWADFAGSGDEGGGAPPSGDGEPGGGAMSEAPAEAVADVEPNDAPDSANPLPPATVRGTFGEPGDADLYRFAAAAGEVWALECRHEFGGNISPADPILEVLHPDGAPVPRVRLRATRASAINFRSIDSYSSGDTRLDFWDEMELDEYLYLSGEVVRFRRAPQGPDSGFEFYTNPRNNHRRNYFGTSAVAHALFEPAYTVEPHPPGADLPDNGLPVFDVPFANDDDPDRELGRSARLLFTAPATGNYLVRVRDVRGGGGSAYGYELTLRPAEPGFAGSAYLEGGGKLPRGGGRRLVCRVDRKDGFDGPVRFGLRSLPPGVRVGGEVVVQAGHLQAEGVLLAGPDAPDATAEQWAAVELTATAEVGGEVRTEPVGNVGEVKLTGPPPWTVRLEPDAGSHVDPDGNLVVRPGETITANLVLDRQPPGRDEPFAGELKFDAENLPHGVIVDNIGLSGVLVRAGESERQIFISAAAMTAPTVRPFFVRGLGGTNECSDIVTLKVAAPDARLAAD